MNFEIYTKKNTIDFILYFVKKRIVAEENNQKKLREIKKIASMLDFLDSDLKELYFDQISEFGKIKKLALKSIIKTTQIEGQKKKEKKQQKTLKKKSESLELESIDAQIEINSENEYDDNSNYGFFKRNGVYYCTKNVNGKSNDVRISNFLMRFMYFIPEEGDNARRIVKLQNKWGDIEITEIRAKQFNIASFKSLLRSKKGGFSYTGDQRDIDLLVEFQQENNEKICKDITTLGFQKEGDFFALSNKIIDSDNKTQNYDDLGVVLNNKEFYYNAAASYFNKDSKNYADLQKFSYRKGKNAIGFLEWANLLKKSYKKDAMIGIAFLAASLFRDIILKVNGQLILLFLRGKPGAGKTKFAESFANLIGTNREHLALTSLSSPKGLFASLSQIENFIIPLDEYKNSLNIEFIEVLKNIYSGYAKKIKAFDQLSHTTITHPVTSAVITMGQDLPTKDIALFERCFLIDFFVSQRDDEQIIAYDKLKLLESEGLTNIIKEIIKHRDHFKENYKEIYHKIFFELKNNKIEKRIDDRLIQNSTQLLASFKLLSDKLELPFSYNEFEELIIERILAQAELIRNTDENAKFWKIFNNLCNDEIKKINKVSYVNKEGHDVNYDEEIVIREASLRSDKHFKRFSYRENDVVGLKFSDVWTLYMKEHQRLYHIPGLGEDNIKSYLIASKAFTHYINPDGKKENTKRERLKLYGNGNSTPVYMFDWNILNNEYFHEFYEPVEERKVENETDIFSFVGDKMSGN